MAPNFFKPLSLELLVNWCERVATAAPDLPFYYYHMPVMTGVSFSMRTFLERAAASIPTLAGIKFTDENLFDFGRAIEFGIGRFELLFGRDEILLAGLALGATGAVGSNYNFAAPLFKSIQFPFASGRMEEAQRHQHQAMRLIALLRRHGGL